MREIYEWKPTGLTPVDYNPKRWFHFHIGEVLILVGLGILIGIIGSEWVITKVLPSKCVCDQIKIVKTIKK